MTAMTGFAQNLIYLRQHYGVTQEALAEQLGVSRQTVSKWEAGINFPETDKLLLLCDLYHTNLDDLMRGSVKVANMKDTDLYDAHMNRFCRGIVAGVVSILCGVAVFLFLGGLGLAEKVCIAVLLAFIVVGAVALVVSALTHEEFKRKHPLLDPFYPAEVLDRFGRRFIILVSGGIAAILIGVILFIAIAPEGGENALVFGVLARESLALTILLLFIALGAGAVVYAGMQKSKYDMSEFDHVVIGGNTRAGAGADSSVITGAPGVNAVVTQSITANKVKRNNIIGAMSGIIMLIATIFFFVLGFYGGNGFPFDGSNVLGSGFMYSWIAFPVGGLFCGIVAIIANALFKSDEELLVEAQKENPWTRVENDRNENL